MAEITAAKVKELRDRTGAGMMDCKDALKAVDGDLDEAIVFLRKKMGNKLENREGRTTAEGVIATYFSGTVAVIVELNSETDFVARSDDFKALAQEIAQQIAVHGGDSTEAVLAQDSLVTPGTTLRSRLEDVFTRLREKIVFNRFARIDAGTEGAVAGYVHIPANNKIGVIVELTAESAEIAASDAVQKVGREVAMQIAAARPRYLNREEVPAEIIATERDIAITQGKNEGRPEAALEKIAEGRLRKYYEEVVLLDQAYLREPKKTVGQVVKETASGLTIKSYIRYEVGEQSKPVEAAE